MERLIAISETSPQICEIDADRFATFMQRKPIWLHYSITQDSYLRKSNEEKAHMINEYYNFMVKGKHFFICCLDLKMPGFKNNLDLSVSLANLFLESERVQSSKFSAAKANIFSLSK